MTVEDTTPPTIVATLTPGVLWPPNHAMIGISADVVAEDNCGAVTFVLDSVVSNEPDDHIGDGNFPDDIQGVEPGTPDLHFQLRAERMQRGSGRVYTATDGSGNQSSDSAEVLVPSNQGN